LVLQQFFLFESLINPIFALQYVLPVV